MEQLRSSRSKLLKNKKEQKNIKPLAYDISDLLNAGLIKRHISLMIKGNATINPATNDTFKCVKNFPKKAVF